MYKIRFPSVTLPSDQNVKYLITSRVLLEEKSLVYDKCKSLISSHPCLLAARLRAVSLSEVVSAAPSLSRSSFTPSRKGML